MPTTRVFLCQASQRFVVRVCGGVFFISISVCVSISVSVCISIAVSISPARHVVRVQRVRQLYVAVRVEPLCEFPALVPEVALDVVPGEGFS